MFVIFGIDKANEPRQPLLDTRCYHCNRNTTWDLYAESEWLTFFFVKTFRIKSKYFLSTQCCSDRVDLDNNTKKKLDRLAHLGETVKAELHDSLVSNLEQHQLAGKTEAQMQFIRSMKNART